MTVNRVKLRTLGEDALMVLAGVIAIPVGIALSPTLGTALAVAWLTDAAWAQRLWRYAEHEGPIHLAFPLTGVMLSSVMGFIVLLVGGSIALVILLITSAH